MNNDEQLKPIPRTANLISLILASKGLNDAPPATIHLLLDFANSKLVCLGLIST